MASKSCALSLVRQLYHLQVIEAYTGVTKKKDTDKVFLTLQFNDLEYVNNKYMYTRDGHKLVGLKEQFIIAVKQNTNYYKIEKLI